jgi:hypothetical protein
VRFLFFILSLLVCPMLHARVGTVRTMAGQEFVGHLRFTKQGVVVVNSAANFALMVGASNIADVSFPQEFAQPKDSTYTGLPDGWSEMEIGTVRVNGGTRCDRNSFTVRAAGAGMDGESDSFHYVYQQVRGDYEILARVSTIQHTAPNAKAALMMRESISDYARNVTIAATAEQGGAFQSRLFEQRAEQVAAQPDIRIGTWLKLRRRGNEFFAFKSVNGRQWTLVEQMNLPMRESYYVGLALCSAVDDTLNWTTFDHVRTGTKLSNEDFTPEIELVSGSIVRGRPVFANNQDVVFEDGFKVVPVKTSRVARITYQPMSSQIAWRSRTSRAGVWVAGGDFLEGEFQEITGDKLKMSSVLYGIRTFDVDEEVVTAVLANASRAEPKVELDIQDGSRLIGERCSFGDGEVVLREAALGEVHVPAFQIRELRLR